MNGPYLERKRAYYTPTEVAKMLGVSKPTVIKWCRNGEIEGAHQTPGGHWRIPSDAVQGVDPVVRVPVVS